NFLQFYKQIHFFGRARINLYTFFPRELKLVHFFPAVFTLGVLFTLIANIFWGWVAKTCDILVAIWIMLIFFHALVKNKSLKVAFLSVIAAFIQLIAYGLGFMQDFWKRVVLKRS
ncbi:MAG: glycosyltransferase, partial [Mucilaginibacter sp.]